MSTRGVRGPWVGGGFVVFALWAMFLGGLAPPGSATVFEPRTFSDDTQANRYKNLVEELRCLVCQNQSLADSNSELAGNLRKEVYDMVRSGADEDVVKDFMVSRYSDYVLYRPPFRVETVLLWVGPFLLGGLGMVWLFLGIRARGRSSALLPLSPDERRRLNEHLGETRGNETDSTREGRD